MAMNAPKKLAFILSAIAMALPQTASAQSLSKAWTGTWHLNTEKSKFSSAEFTSKSDTRTYTVAGRRLTMQSTMINADGKKIKWSYSANTNGKWYRTFGNPNTDHVALTYVSPRELKSKTTLKGKPSARSTVTVSADGKVLTINRSILTAKGGPTADIMVFDRAK
jgi:Tfp pilus assembly protein FimT